MDVIEKYFPYAFTKMCEQDCLLGKVRMSDSYKQFIKSSEYDDDDERT